LQQRRRRHGRCGDQRRVAEVTVGGAGRREARESARSGVPVGEPSAPPLHRAARRFDAPRERRGREGGSSSKRSSLSSAPLPAGGKSARIVSSAARLTAPTSSNGAMHAVDGATPSGIADQARRPQVVQQNGRLSENARSHNS